MSDVPVILFPHDTRRDFAYLTDSGLGGIVVVDLKNDQAWRRLDKHPSVLAESIVPIVEGREHLRAPIKGQSHHGATLARSGRPFHQLHF